MKPIKKILIVCTGNSCRSIMAEGYLAKRLKEETKGNIEISSAGTLGSIGSKPTEETVQVMKENGMDVSGYLSSNLDVAKIKAADIILVMEPYHKEKVLNLVPDSGEKIHFLKGFSSEKGRNHVVIDDPIGKPVDFYRIVFKVIKDSVEGFLAWLKK